MTDAAIHVDCVGEDSPEALPAGDPSLCFVEVRRLVSEFGRPNATIYWADFLGSALGTYATFELFNYVAAQVNRFDSSLWQFVAAVGAFATCCLLAYRAVSFLHELAHVRDGALPGFRVAWNVLCGVPFLAPSFLYDTHREHHRRDHYGTEHDGEYFFFAGSTRWRAIGFLALSPVIPFAAFVRFAVLSPLAWMIPSVRQWVDVRASSLAVSPRYERPPFREEERTIARWQEILCFLWCVALACACYFAPALVVPRLIAGYGVAVVVLLLNALRTLGAHRWRGDGEATTPLGQLLDSVNYPRDAWWNELLMPVGLRFHALHHLLPAIPYHNLPQAHAALIAELPADAAYRRAESESLTQALIELWQFVPPTSHKPDG